MFLRFEFEWYINSYFLMSVFSFGYGGLGVGFIDRKRYFGFGCSCVGWYWEGSWCFGSEGF